MSPLLQQHREQLDDVGLIVDDQYAERFQSIQSIMERMPASVRRVTTFVRIVQRGTEPHIRDDAGRSSAACHEAFELFWVAGSAIDDLYVRDVLQQLECGIAKQR